MFNFSQEEDSWQIHTLQLLNKVHSAQFSFTILILILELKITIKMEVSTDFGYKSLKKKYATDFNSVAKVDWIQYLYVTKKTLENCKLESITPWIRESYIPNLCQSIM